VLKFESSDDCDSKEELNFDQKMAMNTVGLKVIVSARKKTREQKSRNTN
jgi:hypothetical protein